MRLDREDGGIRATDRADESVLVATDGWESGGESPAIDSFEAGPETADETVRGRTRRLSVPGTVLVAFSEEPTPEATIGPQGGSVSLDDRRWLVRVETPVRLYVAFRGPATVDAPSERTGMSVVFDEPRPVTLGFLSLAPEVDRALVTRPTPAGLAGVVERLAGVTDTFNPDRSWPTKRDTPPRVRLREDAPVSFEPSVPETDVEIQLRSSVRQVLAAAPLAYYLGATLSIGADSPRLIAGDRRVSAPDGDLSAWLNDCLERVFCLDCVARSGGPHGYDTPATSVVSELGLDADRLYEASMAERLTTYLATDFESVRDRFPPWHLDVHLPPRAAYGRLLPSLVPSLPRVQPPESAESRSGRQTTAEGRELVHPSTDARLHGWLGQGVPAEGFEMLPAGYDHGRAALGDPSTVSVAAVFNGGATRREHQRAGAHYETRAEETNLDASVRTELTTAELARLFESSVGLVHFVGHRDERGLQCADGFLDTASLASVNAETFFLNACGSYPEGRQLIQKGAVAGGVTVERVLDEDAAAVGVAFARAVVDGYSVARALSVASQPSLSPADYVVVGDGAHIVARQVLGPADRRRLTRTDDGFRLVTWDAEPSQAGSIVISEFEHVEEPPHLSGQRREYEFTREELLDEVGTWGYPVLFEGRLYWPSELEAHLTE